ncbi:MAG: hypothetical protein KAT37_01975 [Candidatus Aenigmarchaeota archaeon]|nr:hypothetical protein [Candidatus Aenigmarchaeota archaeon]
MRKISGFCERCENYSPFLENKNSLWLCTVCRDETGRLNRVVIPRFGSRLFIKR